MRKTRYLVETGAEEVVRRSSRLLLCSAVSHYCGLTQRGGEEEEEEQTLRPMVGLAS